MLIAIPQLPMSTVSSVAGKGLRSRGNFNSATVSTSSSTTPWHAARIEMPGGRRSWTVLDDRGDIVECLRYRIVHLEQTHASPNTIRAYVRHVADFANFLSANGAGLSDATVPLYDSLLAWRLARRKDALPSPKLILLRKPEVRMLAPATRNQIQLAIKSFYRFLNGTDDFAINTVEVAKFHDGHRLYRPFLERISQRRTTRRKDRICLATPAGSSSRCSKSG